MLNIFLFFCAENTAVNYDFTDLEKPTNTNVPLELAMLS